MNVQSIPEATIDLSLKREIDGLAATYASTEAAEIAALTDSLCAPLRGDRRWMAFCEVVTLTIHRCGYLVFAGLRLTKGGHCSSSALRSEPRSIHTDHSAFEAIPDVALDE